MTYNVKFQIANYDPFIDFLKGVCIVLVLINHCLSGAQEAHSLFQVWGRTAVPIFFIIQVFHVYKNGFDFRIPNVRKLWKRIVWPFFAMQLLTAILVLTISQGVDLRAYLSYVLRMGGMGPGEYYLWVYLQFAFIVPMIAPVFKKMRPIPLLLLFIGISQLFELLACLSNIADWPYYSLCFMRYAFLIYLGYVLVTNGFTLNKWTIGISIVSLIATCFLTYTCYDYEPYFFARTQWRYCHWICYIYISFLVIPLLKFLYERIKKYDKLSKIIKLLGANSYEIYLFQMLYFTITSNYTYRIICQIGKGNFSTITYIIITILICAIVPLLFKFLWQKFFVRSNHKICD